MKIPMRKKQDAMRLLLVGTIASILGAGLADGTLQTICVALLVVCFVGFTLCWIFLWRCPLCGKHLGKYGPVKVCPHCKKEIPQD